MHDAVTDSISSGKGLYTLDKDLLQKLQPDVILTQSLCSVCSIDLCVVERCVASLQPQPLVVSLNPSNIQDVIQDCKTVGASVGLAKEGEAAAAALQARVDAALHQAVSLGPAVHQKVVFLEWTEPLFPGGHWTPQMIRMAGGSHSVNPPMGDGGAPPSTVIPPEAVVEADPDLVIICPCGLGLEVAEREARHMARNKWWQSLRAVAQGNVLLVDGNEMFNRSGPRLVDALEWLVAVLRDRHDLVPQGFPYAPFNTTQDMSQEAMQPMAAGLTEVAASEAAAGAGQGAHDRPWLPVQLPAAVGQPPDIEEAHAAACASGQGSYQDPKTGYMVFTEKPLIDRGTCCGNACRHCPWGHYHVSASRRRVNRLTRAALLEPKLQGVQVQAQQPAVARMPPDALLLVWDGIAECQAAADKLLQEGKAVVLLVAFDVCTQLLWSQQGTEEAPLHLHSVFECSQRCGWPLAAVPLQDGAWTADEHMVAAAAAHVVKAAMTLLSTTSPTLAVCSPRVPVLTTTPQSRGATAHCNKAWQSVLSLAGGHAQLELL